MFSGAGAVKGALEKAAARRCPVFSKLGQFISLSQSLLRGPNCYHSVVSCLLRYVHWGTRTLWGDLSCFMGLNVALGCPPATELSNLVLFTSVGQWPTARIISASPSAIYVHSPPLPPPQPPPPTLLSSSFLFGQPDCASHFGFCTWQHWAGNIKQTLVKLIGPFDIVTGEQTLVAELLRTSEKQPSDFMEQIAYSIWIAWTKDPSTMSEKWSRYLWPQKKRRPVQYSSYFTIDYQQDFVAQR